MKSLTRPNEHEVKTGTLDAACMRYGFGKNTMRKMAEEAGAVIKYGKCLRINFTRLDEFLDSISGR